MEAFRTYLGKLLRHGSSLGNTCLLLPEPLVGCQRIIGTCVRLNRYGTGYIDRYLLNKYLPTKYEAAGLDHYLLHTK